MKIILNIAKAVARTNSPLYIKPASFSTIRDSIKAEVKSSIENLDKTEEKKNPEDEGIHPDWLALERRLLNRRSKPKG